MKKVSLLFSLLVLWSAITAASDIREAKITGYKPGEFSVKGDIERQLTASVIAPVASLQAQGDGMSIVVVGYADQTGTPALNDRVGKMRAEEVKEVLLGKFPKATILALSKGDELNSKMVVVRWTLAPPATVAQTKAKNAPLRLLVPAVILVAALLLIGVFLQRKKKRIEMVTVPFGEKQYAVPVIQKGSIWYTPFVTQADPDKILFRAKLKDAVRVVKSCANNSFYHPAIEKLIADGKMKEIRP